MNFTNRDSSGQQSQPAQNSGSGPTRANLGANSNTLKHNAAGDHRHRPAWLRGVWLVLLISVVVLLSSLVYLLYASNPNTNKFVDSKRLQAVFLSNGQVYFGHINSISSKYIDLRDIFYLNNPNTQSNSPISSSSNNSNNLSLVKLGCELHGPLDAMVINQDQVTFWENLRDDGQVAKAVAQYIKDNPDGLKCDTTNQQSNAATQDAGGLQNDATSNSTTKPQP